MGSANAADAYRAIWSFASLGEASNSFLRTKLRRAPVIHKDQIKQLVSRLSDKKYKIRKKAYGELEKLGHVPRKFLLNELKHNRSLEVRTHIGQLLTKNAYFNKGELRLMRSIQVLEYIQSRKAVEILKELEKGCGESYITQNAKLALRRIERARCRENGDIVD
jgi:hypothetical protein